MELALKAGVTFAQFVMMTPFLNSGLRPMEKRWAKNPMMVGIHRSRVTGSFLHGHPAEDVYAAPVDELVDEIRERTQRVWDQFYEMGAIWKRSPAPGRCGLVAFLLLSATSADVCRNGNFDGQCPTEKGEGLGALDCPADAQDIPSEADAAAEVAVLGTSSKKFATANAAEDAGSARVWA